MTCQHGAENALKAEISREFPDVRFAFARPGFLSGKTDSLPEVFDGIRRKSVFARSLSESLGKLSAADPQTFARKTIELLELLDCVRKIERIHIFPRDIGRVGENGFEPGIGPHEREFALALENVLHDKTRLENPIFQPRDGERVLDCIEVDPGQWWIGRHKINRTYFRGRFPGGLLPLTLPSDAVSRAWLKFEEGLRWSGLPIVPGSRCADIGASPGGGSQALLARGAFVQGIDPAEMNPLLLAHPNFTHLRGRVGQLKRNLFRKTRWLIADMNVAPGFTLEVLEDIVLRYDTNIKGLLFTLKLPDWKLAEEIPTYLERIRSWGYSIVMAAQLQFNRREIMISAR